MALDHSSKLGDRKMLIRALLILTILSSTAVAGRWRGIISSVAAVQAQETKIVETKSEVEEVSEPYRPPLKSDNPSTSLENTPNIRRTRFFRRRGSR
jgi:hypothetical protein